MAKKVTKEYLTKLDDLVALVVDIRETARKQYKRNRQEVTRLRTRLADIEERALQAGGSSV